MRSTNFLSNNSEILFNVSRFCLEIVFFSIVIALNLIQMSQNNALVDVISTNRNCQRMLVDFFRWIKKSLFLTKQRKSFLKKCTWPKKFLTKISFGLFLLEETVIGSINDRHEFYLERKEKTSINNYSYDLSNIRFEELFWELSSLWLVATI